MSRRRSYSEALRETWRSVLSWMHWRQRREQAYLAQLVEVQALQMERIELENQQHLDRLRSLLLEALTPLSQALQRQDELAKEQHRLLVDLQMETHGQQKDLLWEQQEMLGEILNSLQPPVFLQLGLPSRPVSSPNSGT